MDAPQTEPEQPPSRPKLPPSQRALLGWADEILPDLWLGGAEAASVVSLDGRNVTHVVNTTSHLDLPPERFVTLRVPVEDSTQDAPKLGSHLGKACAFIEDALQKRGVVLVHCMAGRSRSASIVIAYCMKVLGIGYDEALAKVKTSRPIIQPNTGFIQELRKLENSLQINDTSN
mmetsp:Transcript_14244/g.30515  ORF Transcript_14244/g.30515 Transcript_14244/m.30515 type:complete len:174 (+) Transcript_14244:262-783(+)